jgi:tRNA-splicing ligase RtcB (3'-phosphate/5'-hydroxy nucleic acid ligase)
LGTLGGGNHFIEVCLDTESDPNVWVMLHSGSRNIGKEMAELHIHKAQGLMGELVKRFGEMSIDKDLAALVVGYSGIQRLPPGPVLVPRLRSGEPQ